MPKAVLITSHFWNSKRKAGFHNIAESLLGRNYEVLFLTGNASYIHHLKGDYRAELSGKAEVNKIINDKENLKTFIRFTALHPVNYRNKFLNSIMLPSVKQYEKALEGFSDLNKFISEAALIVFESFPGLLWFDHIRKINSRARFVYRVSDDMRQLKKHPYVIDHERNIIDRFDLVSVPSEYFLKIFPGSNTKLQYHGINRGLFDKAYENPYGNPDSFKFIFTGNAYFDYDFLQIASSAFSEDEFHLFGPLKNKIRGSNIFYYGETDFVKTIPYIKYADAGMHTLTYTKGSESFSDSLKVIQYIYCGLPVIAPEFIKNSKYEFFGYIPEDSGSIIKAVKDLKKAGRKNQIPDFIQSWDELTGKLING